MQSRRIPQFPHFHYTVMAKDKLSLFFYLFHFCCFFYVRSGPASIAPSILAIPITHAPKTHFEWQTGHFLLFSRKFSTPLSFSLWRFNKKQSVGEELGHSISISNRKCARHALVAQPNKKIEERKKRRPKGAFPQIQSDDRNVSLSKTRKAQ